MTIVDAPKRTKQPTTAAALERAFTLPVSNMKPMLAMAMIAITVANVPRSVD
jgi:hypothetical protein